MTGWGDSFWGLDPWGSPLGTVSALIDLGPMIVQKYPRHQQIDVPEDTTILVRIFDPTYDLNPATVMLYVNNTLAYSGVTGFSTGFIGRVTILAGALTVQLFKTGGYEYEQQVTARIVASDLMANTVDDTWYFTIRANEICYPGTARLAVESALQQEFVTFTSLEFFRKLMLDISLRIQIRAINNRENKAVRVIYQLGYATELSTLQNLFFTRDAVALSSTVCEQQKTLYIDSQLQKYRTKINEVINEFSLLKQLPVEYVQTFRDYADSPLYLYRVSLIANMLLYAASVELASS